MVCVSENNLSANSSELVDEHRFHRALRSYRHEAKRADDD
jgi:hypothetical protein